MAFNINFQSLVSQFFEWQTLLVVRWPLLFLTIPPLLTFFITVLTISDLHVETTNETLQVFLPDEMQSLTNLKELIALFPPRDAQRDSYSVFGSKFIYTVIEDLNGDILTESGIDRTTQLHKKVLGLTTASGIKLPQICLRETRDSDCTFHPLAYALQDDYPYLSVQFLLRYPTMQLGDLAIDNALVFGGVQIMNESIDASGNAPMDKAAAIRIFYLIENSPKGEEWIDYFLSVIPKHHENNTRILWSSSKSLANEMERNGALLIPYMPWTALLLIAFCMAACSSKDPVKSQPLIGFFAMFSATLSTVASTALLLYLRYPFLPLVFIMPFLVISIGTDNMFLMLNSWRMARGKDLEKRFTSALTETSASLFLTSLTDGLSFSIGSISEFYAVRVFCTYCAMAILFMFLFQTTFLSAVMVLCCRREFAGKHILHCLPCFKKRCKNTKVSIEITHAFRPPSHHAISRTSRVATFLGRALMHPCVRILIFILFLIYLALSVAYSLTLPLGLDLRLLTPDGSYVAEELQQQEQLFGNYGPYCFALVKLHNYSLVDANIRVQLVDLYENLGSHPLVSKAEFWLVDFQKFIAKRQPQDQTAFQDALFTFLGNPQNQRFRTDIRFTLDGRIEAIKMLLRVRHLKPAHDEPRATHLRMTIAASGFDGFVYDTSFLLVDQQTITVYNVVVNVISAIITMVVICCFMVPRLLSIFCIAVSILSINIGVVGALSAFSTRLDIISMITIVMSVGFSVDYVTHTTFHYVVQKDDRLQRCLSVMFSPILQSALSTAVGVIPLVFVPSYIVRTFVYTVLFVVAIGLLHGVLFLPVLLDTVVPKSEYLEAYGVEESDDEKEFQIHPNTIYFVSVVNKNRMLYQ